MVVAKAKAGVDAASKQDSSTVGALVKKVGAICALIAAASFFQMMGTMKSSSPAATAVQSSTPKLQASSQGYHPASYNDKSSSHYKGGAHNVFLQAVADGTVSLES
jgi:hypothetical protein